jgi:succinyl-CoA synthetase alpha subunit
VFDTVKEAWERVGKIDASVVFVPAPLVKNAALEAFDAGVQLLLLVPDRVPIYDVLEIAAAAKDREAEFIGPNCLGVLSPGEAVLGMIGGRAEAARSWFFPGPVGIISRSGGITSSMAYYLGKKGIGSTTLVHVGGDVVVGLPIPKVVRLFQNDPDTKAIVIFGEIGGSQEEQVADMVEAGEVTKPIVAFIGGKAAKSGTRFSHAGAIIEGNRGTHEGKVQRLREVGAVVVDSFGDLPEATSKVLDMHGIKYGVG